MEFTTEEVMCILICTENVELKLKPERIGIQEINKFREADGEYHHLFPELRADEERFFEYLRMSISTFYYILEKIHHRLLKKWCNFHRQKILPEERLVITLRYLATGMSFRELALSFRMGKSTIGDIVKETINVLWEELQPLHMPVPTTDSLKNNAAEFEKMWNFPHAVGCVDGKNIRIVCPSSPGSVFLNYKKFFSVVLLGLVDANYKFITVDVGGNGKQRDNGTFLASDLFRFINEINSTFPEPDFLPQSEVKAPYVVLADDAYPLLPNLMKPYKRKNLTISQCNFNKRLSTARKTVQDAFGILYSKWRILSKAIETRADVADSIIKCVCVLHNTIIEKEGVEKHLVDVTEIGDSVIWERQGRHSLKAKEARDIFSIYMEKHSVPD